VSDAGVPAVRRGDLLELRTEDFDRVMAVNLRAPFFVAQAVARSMLAEAPGAAPRSIVRSSPCRRSARRAPRPSAPSTAFRRARCR
jgi:NAD(P)-dependent dehydrogenase (short-subunit alcohol dehydrogenase family)